MISIRKILSSEWLESLSITTLIYAIVFLILSLVSISVPPVKNDILILESSIIDTKILEENIQTDEINTFDQAITIVRPPSESMIFLSKDIETINISIDPLDTNETSKDISISSLLDIENINQPINIGSSISNNVNIGGVMDRLTIEIINNTQSRNLNVIWVFDASISLSKQRLDISNRFQKILNEISYNAKTNSIKHTIVSFGSSYSILVEQSSGDIGQLTNAINNIKLDESGIENIYSTIEKLCQKYHTSKNMIIVFTDEVGDDISFLDKACFEARRKGTSVYVVGPPAPFGLSKIQFKYVDPDPKYDQNEKWVEINQGPETLFKMTLDLHSLEVDKSGIDSGFGPYGLNKLCVDTGGVYFSVHPNRDQNIVSKKQIQPLASYISIFFDESIMKQYSPDYRSPLAQQKELENNKIKQALLRACQIPIHIVYDQQMNFTVFNEGQFAEQLNEAQKFSARIEPKLDQIYSILKDVEAYAKNLTDKRWKASYSLAMGRILATKCRIELYNAMLAEAKSGLKKTKKENNIWTIEYDQEFFAKNSQLQKYHDSAIKYLKYVIDEFPGTPWAYVGKAELDSPMGYKWVEGYKEPPKMNTGGGNNNNNPPKDDTKKKIEYKPQRNTDKI